MSDRWVSKYGINFRAWHKESGLFEFFNLKDVCRFLESDVLDEFEIMLSTEQEDKFAHTVYELDILEDEHGDKFTVRFGTVDVEDNEGVSDNRVLGFFRLYLSDDQARHLESLSRCKILGTEFDKEIM